MTEDEDRRRLFCWGAGIRLDEIAGNLLQLRDTAIDQHPEGHGGLLVPEAVQDQVDEGNRKAILHWAREFDKTLTRSEECGVGRSGSLGAEFGRIEDWEKTEDLEQLEERIVKLVTAVHDAARYELGGEGG